MKLILLYGGVDGGEFHLADTQPIEYESKDALKRDLTEAVLKTIERWKGRKKWTLQEWQAAFDEACKSSEQKHYEAVSMKLHEQGFVHDGGGFDFCGMRLIASYFCEGGHGSMSGFYRDEDCVFNPTSIEEGVLTLDEWFDINAIKQKPA